MPVAAAAAGRGGATAAAGRAGGARAGGAVTPGAGGGGAARSQPVAGSPRFGFFRRSTASSSTSTSSQTTTSNRTSTGSTAGLEAKVDGLLDQSRRLTLTPPAKVTVRDGAGFLGGLLLYTLALNYLRYGPDGVKGWIAAKFVNRPMALDVETSGYESGEDDTEETT